MLVIGACAWRIGTGSNHAEGSQPVRHSVYAPGSHNFVHRQKVDGLMTEEKIDSFVEENMHAWSALKQNGTERGTTFSGRIFSNISL